MVEEKGKIVEKEEKMKEEVKDTKKTEDKKTEVKKEIKKKDKAIARGLNLRISPKYSKFICRVIKGKTPENAVKRLQEVVDKRRPIPMPSLEVGHKKGRGLSGAKFPITACREIINVVKQAEANAAVVEIENPIITIAKSNQAPTPFRSGGRRAKRTHIEIEVRSKQTGVKK